MHVWMVCPTYPTAGRPDGGAFVRHQAEAMAARGHRVTVVELAPAARGSPWAILGPARWSTDPGGGLQVIRAKVAGGPMPGLRALGRRSGARALAQIAAVHGAPDLLHLHFTQLPGLAGTAFAARLGIPTVLTVHENEAWLRAEARVGLCRRAWRDAGCLVRVSARDSGSLRRWNACVHVVPNGFAREHVAGAGKEEARRELGLGPAPAQWVACVGSFIPRKRQDLVLRALARLRGGGRDVRLLLVGDGPERGSLEALAARLGVAGAVHFAGRVPPRGLALAYAAADVVCLASDAEGNPTVLFEALGAGRPFVGTDVGGASGILAETGHGAVVPRGDAPGLAAALADALDRMPDPADVRRAAAPFSWDAVAGRLEAVYAAVASRSA